VNDRERPASDIVGRTPPPEGFDALAAGVKDLVKYSLPQRPDPQSQPGLSALWERQARRYRAFEHLQTQFERPALKQDASPAALGLEPSETCGYSLVSVGAPFTALFVTWTVPNLRYVASPQGPDRFHTFAGLGFLDVHVEMTVDQAQTVTATVTALGVSSVGLPVQPGDVLSASICLDTQPPGRATYVLANETRSQTVNFSFDTGFPPAVTVDAGVSRGALNNPFNPLAQFGVVYFDEISAYTTNGPTSLTSGQAVTMVDRDGATLATPFRLNDSAFKTVRSG
jgi:hypothetical protein